MSNIPRHLNDIINSIPNRPGIYQMKDVKGNIIYIGKSKALKKRVKSYFYAKHEFGKINRLVINIHDISYITTDTHLEAQILECALIKKIKPFFNSQFKNHKKYNYLKVEDYNKFKPLTIVNERVEKNCFGPYRNKTALLEIVEIFNNIYPIIRDNDEYQFTYKIIPGPMKKETFENNKQSVFEILSHPECMMKFINQVEKKMQESAVELSFDKAAIYRDMINYMSYLHKHMNEESCNITNKRILLGEKIDGGYKIFSIDNGRIILKKKYTKITKKDISEFLNQAEKFSNRTMITRDEKRDLDFKQIINAEIRDKSNKVILSIGNKYNVDDIINEIINI